MFAARNQSGTDAAWGIVLVMISAALWGTTGVATRLVHTADAVPPEVFGFARAAIATPAIFLAVAIGRTPGENLGSRPGLLHLAGFGLLAGIFQLCLFKCFALLGIGPTVFVTVCLPVVLAAGWTSLRGDGISGAATGALLLSIVGVACFGFGAQERQAGNRSVYLGMTLAIVASVAWLLLAEMTHRLGRRFAPLKVSGYGLAATALVLAPPMLASMTAWPAWDAGDPDWLLALLLIYLGIGPTALAYICYCHGMARSRSAAVGLIATMLEPAVATGLGVLLLHDNPTPLEIAGSLLLIAAMLILWLDERRRC